MNEDSEFEKLLSELRQLPAAPPQTQRWQAAVERELSRPAIPWSRPRVWAAPIAAALMVGFLVGFLSARGGGLPSPEFSNLEPDATIQYVYDKTE